MALPAIWGGVLVGGRSRRMGTPKQNLVYKGRTFAERVVSALEPHTDGVALLGAREVTAGLAGLVRLADDARASGPLAGILAACSSRPEVAWLVVGCDLPLVSTAAIRWLVGQRDGDCVAILPRLGPARIEPLLALYEPAALALLLALVATGENSLQPLDGMPRVATPSPPAAIRDCWRNVNTVAEMRELGAGAQGVALG